MHHRGAPMIPPKPQMPQAGVPILNPSPGERQFQIVIAGTTDGNQVDLSRYAVKGVTPMEARQILSDLAKVVVPSGAPTASVAGPDGVPPATPQE